MTPGIQETNDIFDALDAVVVWWDVSHKDGKIDAHDLIAGAPLLIKMYSALKGVSKVPEELKNATAEECQALAQKGIDLVISTLRTVLGDKLPL